MKDSKITVVFDKDDAKKFDEISKRSRWTDKFLITITLRHYYEEFKKDWKRTVIEALEGDKK